MSVQPTRTWPRLAGAAALVYVAGVSIENMGVLEAPTPGAPIGDIREELADHALKVVTSFAGTIALLAYVVFAAALYVWLRAREAPGDPWATLGLAGGIAGPVLAGAGEAANAVVVARSGALGDDATRALFEFQPLSQMVAGVFVALTLAGFGVAGLRTGALPRWLAWWACALAVPMAFAPIAAFVDDDTLRVVVTLLYSAQTAWLFLLGIWMALGGDMPLLTLVRRGAFLTLALAAGLVGIAMVAVPDATGEYFGWGLGPAPLAAFAGGVYIGSAVLYAIALPEPWPRVRGLVLGAVLLSVSVLVVTLVHLEIFDFDRLQAWAWLVLFAGFSVLTTALLVLSRDEMPPAEPTPLPGRVRALFAVVAALLGALGLALWIEPVDTGGRGPFDVTPLGGSFAGSWILLLAVLCAWGAARNRRDEGRLSALALVLLPAGGLVAGLRTIDDLDPPGAYLAVLAALVLAGLAALRGSRLR